MGFDLLTVYTVCAAVGGLLLVIQVLMMVIGLDGIEDADSADFAMDEAGHGGNLFFGYLSLKTLVAFSTFFGLTGLLVEKSSWGVSSGWGVVIAIGAGLTAFYVVGLLMASLHRLQASGNIDIKDAVGQDATVYVKIPSNKSGTGKVTVSLQERSLQVPAVTDGEELCTGSQVRVIGIADSALEVIAL